MTTHGAQVGASQLRAALVVKVGSSLVTNDGRGLDHAAIGEWARADRRTQAAPARKSCWSPAARSPRACSAWAGRRDRRPMHELQAAAAVGQMGLIQVYESSFARFGTAHRADPAHPRRPGRSPALSQRRLDAAHPARAAVSFPIINENDTVITDEIRLGDNDTLGALVANLIEADVLILLTDQAGLYTSDPRKDATATLVSRRSPATRRSKRWPAVPDRRSARAACSPRCSPPSARRAAACRPSSPTAARTTCSRGLPLAKRSARN